MNRRLTAAVLLCAAAAIAPATRTMLGPPMICQGVTIDDAKSIRYDASTPTHKANYAAGDVIKDTLGVLKTSESALVRMETLRRATLYLESDKAHAQELLAKLAFIAMDVEASTDSSSRAAAWFNAGYLAACYQQMGVDIDWNPGVQADVHGYLWIRKALSISNDPEMNYGAAIARHPAMARDNKDAARKQYVTHMAVAIQGCQSNNLLKKNVDGHLNTWGGTAKSILDQAK